MDVGTDVRLGGIKIGSISNLTLDPKTYLVTVHMDIEDKYKIPADSSLIMTSAGILGSAYLSITPGGDDKMLPAGGEIVNVQAANSMDLMSLVGRIAGGGTSSSTNTNTNNQAPPPKPAQPAPSSP